MKARLVEVSQPLLAHNCDESQYASGHEQAALWNEGEELRRDTQLIFTETVVIILVAGSTLETSVDV